VTDPALRAVLDGTPIAHLATLLPDGAPHSVPVWIGTVGEQVAIMTGPTSLKARNLRRDPRMAISLTREDDRFRSIVLRGRVTGWLEGDEAWAVVDALAAKYLGMPYPRGADRVAALIELDHEVLR
jgi:PPOX class probable F420-dependent enzyme